MAFVLHNLSLIYSKRF